LDWEVEKMVGYTKKSGETYTKWENVPGLERSVSCLNE
jgi:hypothetical protein